MSSGERPEGAAKGKQSETEAFTHMRIPCMDAQTLLQSACRVHLWHTVSTEYRPLDRCAPVNAVAALCFGKGALSSILSPHAYNMCMLYTSAQCLQTIPASTCMCTVSTVHSVYRLDSGKRICAQCLHVCAVSTDYTQVNACVHSVYMYACVYACTQTPYMDMASVHVCAHTREHAYSCTRIFTCAYPLRIHIPVFMPMHACECT